MARMQFGITAFERAEGDLPELTLRIHRRLFEGSRNAMSRMKAGQWKDRVNAVEDKSAPKGFFHYTHPRSLRDAMNEWREFTRKGYTATSDTPDTD